MAQIAGEKRNLVAICALVAILLVALFAGSLNAFGVEEGSSSSSQAGVASSPSSTEGDASSSSSAPDPAAQPSDAAAPAAGASGAENGAQTALTPAEQVSQEVAAALARPVIPENRALGTVEGAESDTGGSAFTFVTPLGSTDVAGDLYWAGNDLELSGSKVGNDVLAVGFHIGFSDSEIRGDARTAGQTTAIKNTVIQGNVDTVGLEVSVDAESAANAFYCGGGSVTFRGYSKRLVAYGQSIYFDGAVDGDVTLSAQDIVIGPNAKISGLLDIRSGQNLETLDIPGSAQIARIDTSLDQPNTIDQITQVRAAIAPYFQVGSLLFVIVSFVLMAMAALWGFGPKLTEANRLVRRYPLAVLVLGCIALMLMFVIVMLGTVLIFTIPLSLLVLFLALALAIFCVPFTGASLGLLLRKRVKPSLCAVLGAGVGGALLFIPHVNAVVFAGSLVYLVGYLVNIAMFGHDAHHDASFHERQADEDAPHGKARGILPVAAAGDAALAVAEELEKPAVSAPKRGDAKAEPAPSPDAEAANDAKPEAADMADADDASGAAPAVKG